MLKDKPEKADTDEKTTKLSTWDINIHRDIRQSPTIFFSNLSKPIIKKHRFKHIKHVNPQKNIKNCLGGKWHGRQY